MKILHIVEASFAGVGRHVQDLVEAQTELHEVTVLYGSHRCSSEFLARATRMPKVSWIPLDTSRLINAGDWKSFKQCKKQIAEMGPDVVHGHSSKGGVLARLCSNKTSAKIVYTPNAIYTMNPELSAGMRFAISTIESNLGRRTDAIVAVSPEEKSHLLTLGIDPKRIVMIPNGIGPIEKLSQEAVRVELGLPQDNLIIGFVGRLDRQKSPDLLLDVFAQLSSDLPRPVTLAIVGEGPMGEAIRELSDKAGYSADQVRFLGYQDGPMAMAAFDIFVLPSRYEGFPYVLIEAAASGLPIVTTIEANASQIVQASLNGFALRFGDTSAMADAVSVLLSDGHLREEFSRSSCELSVSFTLERMCRETQQLYQSLLDA